MKSNYETLGKYINLVDERNSDDKFKTVLGINIDKYYMPSVANTIGTDLSKYKVVRKKRFACNPMHVGRDERLPVALFLNEVPGIVSPAYFTFDISDKNKLNPEYLMMWFRRKEFDRVCWLKTDGSVRGGLSWDDLCRMDIQIPSIEEQNEIVKAYNVVKDRIQLKQQINDNLAATINMMFMELYSNLDDEQCKPLEQICTLTSSKRVFAEDYANAGIPFYRGKEITLKQSGQPITEPLYIEKSHFEALKQNYGIPVCGDILITAVGTIGNSYLVHNEQFYFKDGNIIWLKDFYDELNYYVYDFMQTPIFRQLLEGICIGSTQTALTITSLAKLQIKIADSEKIKQYTKKSQKLHTAIEHNIHEISQLFIVRDILLAELSR